MDSGRSIRVSRGGRPGGPRGPDGGPGLAAVPAGPAALAELGWAVINASHGDVIRRLSGVHRTAHTETYAYTANLSAANGSFDRCGPERYGVSGHDGGSGRYGPLSRWLPWRRARGHPDDGEPLVRPFPELAAGCRRPA